MKRFTSITLLAPILLAASLLACDKCRVDQREPVQTYFGINADPMSERVTDTRRLYNALHDSSAGSVRMPLRWDQLQPARDRWIFNRADVAINQLPNDIEVIIVLTGVPEWAKATDDTSGYPFQSLADWGNFVDVVVKRYKNRVRHWEIWDAPNTDSFGPHPTARAYFDVLKSSYEAIKAIDSKCLVLLGGMDANGIATGPFSRAKTENFLVDLYEAGGGSYFDACNIHPYVQPLDGAPRVLELAQDTIKVMAKYGDADKPLYLTEVGIAGADEDTQAAQAQMLSDTFKVAIKEKQICHVMWSSLRDNGRGSMGILDHAWHKKPAFEAFHKAAVEKVIK
jgi:GH35 family endo-1,4-beta-xylanase